eukprot:TRINITY_DN102959_c0_g1_i1.p1 TRINITY_DN102959_c0_g1~~TRINITY_DN102959_c0_g1_i1.p1  ORF type:complete len:443 (-),score=12.95 TRINITY_DN102959_c0_g1_i1:164-1492(-)
MGWEWQVFLDGSTSFDVWKHLKLPTPPLNSCDEVYYACTDTIEVKQRTGSLGYRVRSKRSKHGLELWKQVKPKKKVKQPVEPDDLFSLMSCDSVQLPGCGGCDIIQTLKQTEADPTVNIQKQVTKVTFKLALGGSLSVSQADISATFPKNCNHCRRFRSLCVEGAKGNVKEFVLKNDFKRLSGVCLHGGCSGHMHCKDRRDRVIGCISMGYASFLTFLFDKFSLPHQRKIGLAPSSFAHSRPSSTNSENENGLTTTEEEGSSSPSSSASASTTQHQLTCTGAKPGTTITFDTTGSTSLPTAQHNTSSIQPQLSGAVPNSDVWGTGLVVEQSPYNMQSNGRALPYTVTPDPTPANTLQSHYEHFKIPQTPTLAPHTLHVGGPSPLPDDVVFGTLTQHGQHHFSSPTGVSLRGGQPAAFMYESFSPDVTLTRTPLPSPENLHTA